MVAKKKTTTKKKAKKSIEPMSFEQFKSKLEGIEMFQGEDWCPDAGQWAVIREMIDAVEESDVVPAASAGQQVHNTQPTARPPFQPPTAKSSLDVSPAPRQPAPRPQPVQGIPVDENVDLTDLSSLQNQAAPVAPSQPVQTPTIDTSDGVYKSSFE